jgi:hypothetical protein
MCNSQLPKNKMDAAQGNVQAAKRWYHRAASLCQKTIKWV